MSSLNQVSLIGRVGKEPEVIATNGGKEMAKFSLACSESWKDRGTGERKEKTEWINIVVYSEPIIGVIKNYVKKGSKLYLQGALETRKYEKDGRDVYTTEVVLKAFGSQIVLLDAKDDSVPTEKVKPKTQPVMDDLDDSIPF